MSASDNESDVSSNSQSDVAAGTEDAFTQPHWDGAIHHFGDAGVGTLIAVGPLSLLQCRQCADFNLTCTHAYAQVVKESQLRNQELSEELQGLRSENTLLSVRTSSGTTGQSKPTLSTEEKQIAYAGEKFCFAHELWIKRETIQKPCPPGVDPNCPSRYESGDKVEEIATLTELYESLSSDLHTALSRPSSSGAFVRLVSPFFFFFDVPLADLLCKFWVQYRSQRAQLVSIARQVAGFIFDLSSTGALRVQSADSPDRANDPELQALLLDPNKPGEMYPLLAPMLFPDRNCNNLPCLFQTQAFASVRHRILLCQCSRH
jgi:hypothetical protein